MRVLLLQPPVLDDTILGLEAYPTLGITSIAAILLERGHEVSLYDTTPYHAKMKEVIKVVEDFSPDVVGITSTTVMASNAFAVANEVKKLNKEVKIVLGGVHVTAVPHHAFSCQNVDYLVLGEGEITMCELLEALQGKKDIARVNGLAYRKNGEIIFNPPRELIKNIDELPIPAYDLLPINLYSSPYVSRKPFMNVVRSRGCPYKCIFCGVPRVFGRGYRCQSPQRTLKEVEYLVTKLNVREILFKDSEFPLNQRITEEFCDLLIERKLDFVWCCNARVSNLNRSLLEKMKKAGCIGLTFGIESGDQKILDTIKKEITLDEARNAIKLAREIGFKIVCNFMLGNPGETRETIEKTIAFSEELNPDYGCFTFLTPYPGTELRELAEKNNWLLDPSMEAVNPDRLIMNATTIPTSELQEYLKKTYKRFYFRPSYILKRLTMLSPNDISNSLRGLKNIILYQFVKQREQN